MKKKDSRIYKLDLFFHRFAKKTAVIIGHPVTFFIALLFIMSWLITGFFFNFSDTWQLIINTLTTIITFLIVFIIQNSQNRDVEDVLIKLDELIRSHKSAKNSVIDLDNLTDEQLQHLEKKYKSLSKRRE